MNHPRNKTPLRIDIWSDFVCPWCWIGKHRLRRALQAEGAPEAELHWHPFQLEPQADTTPVPLREAYARKFGGAGRAEQMLAQVQQVARAEGLPMDFDQGQVRVSTADAHRLLALASSLGVADAVSEALFRAHFVLGRNLADPATLIEAAASGGIDAAQVQQMLAGADSAAHLQHALAQAQSMGIQGVPLFVLDRQLAVSGAQPPEVFAQTFAQLGHGSAAAAAKDADAGAGAACDVDRGDC